MIQRIASKIILGLMVLAISAIAIAKSHPYSVEFERQVQQLFLDSSMKVSVQKTDAYIGRLLLKKQQLKALLIGGERAKGETDAAKIEKKIADENVLEAMDIAVKTLNSIKMMSNQAQIFESIKMALDIEGAIRITGSVADPIEYIAQTIKTFGGTWKIPKQSTAEQEASNLFNSATDSYLSTAEIASLKARGADLSLYGPGNNSPFWQAPRAGVAAVNVQAAADGKLHEMYRNFEGFPTKLEFNFDKVKKTNTKPKLNLTYVGSDGKKHRIKFKLGAELHADPTVSAFMLSLGFPSNLTRYVRNVKVNLGKNSLSDLTKEWESYFSRDGQRRWKIENYIASSGKNEKGEQWVVFKDGLLEAKPDVHNNLGGWKFAENTSLREVRALMFVQMFFDNNDVKEFDNNELVLTKDANGNAKRYMVLADVGKALGGSIVMESPDQVAWDMVSDENSNEFKFSYRDMHPVAIKNKITLADAKWATRLISGLTRQQIDQAVARGNWPQCIAKIYSEKLVARRNALVRRFGLANQIAMLPETQDRNQFQKDIACQSQELAINNNFTSKFDSSTSTFFNNMSHVLKGTVLDVARQVVNDKRRWVIQSATVNDFKLDQKMVSEIILNFRRDIERNNSPKSEQDQWIVKDQFELGFRLGVSFGAYKDLIYTRSFTLAYPARSYVEAQTNNGFIVNLMLARDIAKGNLPPSYVLKTEHYLENGAGVDFSYPLGIVSPIIRAGVAKVNLWRSILDHRDGNEVILYRDRSDFTQVRLQALLGIALIRLNVFETLAGWGTAEGRGSIYTKADLNDASKSNAIGQAVIDGDFKKIQPNEKQFQLTDNFTFSSKKWSLIFWKGGSSKRLDKIEITSGDSSREALQFRTTKEKASGLSSNKRSSKTVEVYLDPNVSKKFRINVRVIGSDIDTLDNELSTYIGFVNNIAPHNQKVIDFNPELGYTTNGRWGSMMVTSETEYSPEGVDRIMRLSDGQLRGAIGEAKNLSVQGFASMLARVKEYRQARSDEQNSVVRTSNHALLKEFGLTRDDVELASATEQFIRNLNEAKRQTMLEKKVKLIAEAIRNSLFSNASGFYDPTILKALNRVAGLDAIYSRNVVSKPPFEEMRVIEEKPIYGEFGTRLKGETKYLVFSPQSPVELYTMFDTWF